ncbi:hypothetical protein [Aquimarina algiphila]|uniref:Uncharacterized protein n=1 Tax=Aquimarina algiphila TaxID=2047982 RepID=A0A554VPD8_9FLAO|nr:hypothetical protein [Aquimarina algiphila]TSE10334.1 hypothetical protein FOF46_04685 [Aquimarina algiphila]
MKDYNSLLKAELVELLEKRDAELARLKGINTTQATDIVKQVAIIQDLRKDLKLCQDNTSPNGDCITTAEELIEAVLCLKEEEIQALPVLLRTTDDGIAAYTAFTYGVLSCVSTPSQGTDPTDPDIICPGLEVPISQNKTI